MRITEALRGLARVGRIRPSGACSPAGSIPSGGASVLQDDGGRIIQECSAVRELLDVRQYGLC